MARHIGEAGQRDRDGWPSISTEDGSVPCDGRERLEPIVRSERSERFAEIALFGWWTLFPTLLLLTFFSGAYGAGS